MKKIVFILALVMTYGLSVATAGTCDGKKKAKVAAVADAGCTDSKVTLAVLDGKTGEATTVAAKADGCSSAKATTVAAKADGCGSAKATTVAAKADGCGSAKVTKVAAKADGCGSAKTTTVAAKAEGCSSSKTVVAEATGQE